MKYPGSFIAFLMITMLSSLVIACKNKVETKVADQNEDPTSVDYNTMELEPADFASKMQKSSSVIVDLRFPPEFEEGHIDNAINVNFFDPSFQTKILELDKSKTYFLYGKGEAPTKRAAIYMKQNGFNEVYTIKGGWEAWNELNRK
jgi:rhodanese-related sulfurtransferase